MNAVGRIFIGLICIMSLVFMSLTIAVYSTGSNWKEQVDKQKVELDKTKAEATALKNRLTELQKSVDEQLAAKDGVNDKLQAQIKVFIEEKRDADVKLADLQGTINMATQTIKEAHTTLAAEQAKYLGLRDKFNETQAAWNVLFTNYVAKAEEAHALLLNLNRLESVSQGLVEQYNNAKLVLDRFGYKPIPEMYEGVPPYQVTGRVTEVRQNGLVRITIGEDSGLMKGHQLDVYRKNDDGREIYLGVVEVMLTEPNQAACKILPEYRKGTVQIDDVVTSEFSQERQKYQIKRDAHVATTIN